MESPNSRECDFELNSFKVLGVTFGMVAHVGQSSHIMRPRIFRMFDCLTLNHGTVILFDNDQGCVSIRYANKKLRPSGVDECRS